MTLNIRLLGPFAVNVDGAETDDEFSAVDRASAPGGR